MLMLFVDLPARHNAKLWAGRFVGDKKNSPENRSCLLYLILSDYGVVLNTAVKTKLVIA